MTVYDESNGSRLDFSATTLENWAAKIANFLNQELDLYSGDRIILDLEPSWQAAVLLYGACAAGIEVSFDAPGQVCFSSLDRQPSTPGTLTVVVSNDPMGRGIVECGAQLPEGMLDFAPLARIYGDHYLEPTPTMEAVCSTHNTPPWPVESRVLIPGWDTVEELYARLCGPLAARGSVVLVTGEATPERLDRIAEIEKVTLSIA